MLQVDVGFSICVITCSDGSFSCMLHGEIACLHVEKNNLVKASYLDIQDLIHVVVSPKKINEQKNKNVILTFLRKMN